MSCSIAVTVSLRAGCFILHVKDKDEALRQEGAWLRRQSVLLPSPTGRPAAAQIVWSLPRADPPARSAGQSPQEGDGDSNRHGRAEEANFRKAWIVQDHFYEKRDQKHLYVSSGPYAWEGTEKNQEGHAPG